jgi:hypothetical protein
MALSTETRTDRPDIAFPIDVASSPADTVAIVGELYGAAERGVTRDVFGAYSRLCRALGRTVLPVMPLALLNGRPLVPLSVRATAAGRLASVHEAVGAAIRNANAVDAARHWHAADAYMRGLALAEALYHQSLATEARLKAIAYRDEGNEPATAQAEATEALRTTDAENYRFMAYRGSW